MLTTDTAEDNETLLTTFDNPFNPFINFDDWMAFDESQGYNSCAYLARVLPEYDEFSEELLTIQTEIAIDLIIRYDPTHMFCRINKKGEKIHPLLKTKVKRLD